MPIILDFSNPSSTFRDVETILSLSASDTSNPAADQLKTINGIEFIPCTYRLTEEMQNSNYDTTFRGYYVKYPNTPATRALQTAAMSSDDQSVIYHDQAHHLSYLFTPRTTAMTLMDIAKTINRLPETVVFSTPATKAVPLWTDIIKSGAPR